MNRTEQSNNNKAGHCLNSKTPSWIDHYANYQPDHVISNYVCTRRKDGSSIERRFLDVFAKIKAQHSTVLSK